jgi:hypothetical protein
MLSPVADQLMPDLLGMLSTPMDKDHRMLKAVGMECAAFIGLAAGKQVSILGLGGDEADCRE